MKEFILKQCLKSETEFSSGSLMTNLLRMLRNLEASRVRLKGMERIVLLQFGASVYTQFMKLILI